MTLSFVLDFQKVARMLDKETLVGLWCAISMARLLPLELSVGGKDVLSLVILVFMEESLKFWTG